MFTIGRQQPQMKLPRSLLEILERQRPSATKVYESNFAAKATRETFRQHVKSWNVATTSFFQAFWSRQEVGRRDFRLTPQGAD